MSISSWVEFSVRRPRLVLAAALLVTLGFGALLPGMRMDTRPKNMLPADAPVRVWNRQVDEMFALHEDTIVVGIHDEGGILDPATLGKILRLTARIQALPGVATADVISLATATHVEAHGDELAIGPLVTSVPGDAEALRRLDRAIARTPAFEGGLISTDRKVTAIFVPLAKDADGKQVTDEIRRLVAAESGPEVFHVTGDPVVEETFGDQMFGAMGLLGPLSGLIMLGLAYSMFRRASLAFAVQGIAILATIWSLGLIIGLGFPVHIMSSMAPVFLMAIATDSIHIFNEYVFRAREQRDRRQAIIDTMRAVKRPILYTDLTTALGFAALMLSSFDPIRIFGLCIAFGTLALLVMSFTVVPALLTFIRVDDRVHSRVEGPGRVEGVLRTLAQLGIRHPRRTLAVGLALLVASGLGMSRIHINNNQIEWFKEGAAIRRSDKLLNDQLGGTSLAHLVVDSGRDEGLHDPAVLRQLEDLQRRLAALPQVGKTMSVVDHLTTMNQALSGGLRLPDDADLVAQYLFLLSTSGRPADVDNVIDAGHRRANLWIQLETWDVVAMRELVAAAETWRAETGTKLTVQPAGLAHLNLVWNDEVLVDVLVGFAVGLLAVFLVLAVNFRSLKWALVSYLPLFATIAVIYGVVGIIGKDFDMPICVLSTLSLGMAVDFAIHFIARFRDRLASVPASPDAVVDALVWTATRPGRGILRNAALFAGTFAVMLFASLTPYVTVGAFMIGMMVLSAVLTLVCLPAVIVAFPRLLGVR